MSGKVIHARMAAQSVPPPFRYFDKGSMATIGYNAAVADAFGIKMTGRPAYLMWGLIHMLYLIGWGNRLGTLYTWLRAMVFTKNRGHRIITYDTTNRELSAEHRLSAAVLPPQPNESG